MLEEMPAKRMSVVEAYPLIAQAIIEQKTDALYADWVEQAVRKADIRVSVYLRAGFAPKSP
jgi:hypothetical protein